MRAIIHCFNKQLTDIYERCSQFEKLTLKIKPLLPELLASECHVGSFNKGCLLLITTNAVWASQLRYEVPTLRDQLRKEAGMYQLSSIKVHVIEAITPYEHSKKPKLPGLSNKTKATLISASQQCTFEPLQKALMHLADVTK